MLKQHCLPGVKNPLSDAYSLTGWILKGRLDSLTVPKRCCLISSLEEWRWGGGQGLSEVVPSFLCRVTSCLKGVSWSSPLADAGVKTCRLFCSRQLCYSSRHLSLCLWLHFGARCTTNASMVMSLKAFVCVCFQHEMHPLLCCVDLVPH